MKQQIEIGKRYRFVYPDYGTPNNYPKHTAHSGQVVRVVRRNGPNTFWVRARDGWEGTAVADELRATRSKR